MRANEKGEEGPGGRDCDFISHKVLYESFCKSKFPHISVNLFFIFIIEKNTLTDLLGS